MPFPDAWQGGVLRKLSVEGSLQEFQQGKSGMYNRRNETNSGDRKMWGGKQGMLTPCSPNLEHCFTPSVASTTQSHICSQQDLLETTTSTDLKYLIFCETKIEFCSLACPASHGSLWDPRGAQHSLWGSGWNLLLLQDVVQVSDRNLSASFRKPGAFPSSER